MGKIVKLLLPFFLAIFAFGGGVFDDFDNKFTKANKQDRIQIYHELKGVYLNSILNDNEKLKLESLKRLVSGAKILGVDDSVYAKELKSIENKKDEKPKATAENKIQTQNKTETKNQVKTQNKAQAKADEKSQNKTENKTPAKAEAKAATKTAVKTTAKSENKSNQIAKILSLSSSKNAFVVNLNTNSNKIDIKISELNQSKSYRKIFEFDGILTTKYENKKSQISDQIRVAQFNKERVRIVFTDDKEQDIEYKFDGNSIVFTLKNSKNTTQKTTAKAVSKTDKKPTTQKNNQKTPTNVANQAKGKIVVLDAGHGGKDVGAVGKNKLYEKNIVLNIALEAGKILKNRGYKVYYTRSNDKFINLRDRTSFANEKKADIFISIHANAAPNEKKAKEMQGIETYFLSPTRSERSMQAANLENKADTDEMNYFTKISYLNFLNREKIIASNKLAIDVQSNLLSAVKSKFKVVDGGVREAPFWVLVGALMPAVLIEAGYITHTNDHKLLSNKSYTDKIALGIADGIDDYFAKNQ
ncbi:N-acetylmuramoyl-L-alanine amidase [Campylobacter lanienae]|uniref:N-acetylmuramoyl-L-alanine amidase family protein n=1 Tax=Campylobacter lanienae TaxID=75658 RepID=UPI0011AC8B5C|nr:N-acetylmuramoyl-L-alanine amidase [Campylobacter lanienae]TWO17407.1 N-acetylmuramoyl-L-alanine amidase [Campylobacter lanienae]